MVWFEIHLYKKENKTRNGALNDGRSRPPKEDFIPLEEISFSVSQEKEFRPVSGSSVSMREGRWGGAPEVGTASHVVISKTGEQGKHGGDSPLVFLVNCLT